MADLWILSEAISSVSLSHAIDCTCLVCRAARGDEKAWIEVVDYAQRNEAKGSRVEAVGS